MSDQTAVPWLEAELLSSAELVVFLVVGKRGKDGLKDGQSPSTEHFTVNHNYSIVSKTQFFSFWFGKNLSLLYSKDYTHYSAIFFLSLQL